MTENHAHTAPRPAAARRLAFGARPGHCAFFPMNSTSVAAHRKELAGFEISAGTIRFQPAKPLPAALVRRIVKERIAENGSKRGKPRCTIFARR